MAISKVRALALLPFTGRGSGYASAGDNLRAFAAGLATASTALKKYRDGGEVTPILLAPEWTFKKKQDVYRYGELGEICEGLTRLSKQYSDLLIFAGSILWAIEGKEEEKQQRKFNFKNLKFDVKYYYRDYLIVYNTALVLRGGDIVHIYHKTHEGLDVDLKQVRAGREVFAFDPGEAKGEKYWKAFKARCETVDASGKNLKPVIAHTFEHEGVTFGVEICADHCNATLAKAARQPVDIQVLVSCGACFSSRGMAVRRGGIALHCDGNAEPPKNEFGFTAFVVDDDKKPTIPKPSKDGKTFFGAKDDRVAVWDELLALC
ncbi:MAG: hypothetical protein KatS3mg102_2819 [Planctomycetota bacterium]|nr:MAG: hypothetical protein KatS3mg102_2819 [Planctomycetota bacterium]